jgi:hypothetical protein
VWLKSPADHREVPLATRPEPSRVGRRQRTVTASRTAVLVGAAVLLAVVLAVRLLAPEDRGEPCVDYIPANVACAKDSPALR